MQIVLSTPVINILKILKIYTCCVGNFLVTTTIEL